MNSTSVRIEPLNRNNFDTWKIQIEALLIKNDLWEFVSGKEIKPKTGNAEITAWEQLDKKARSDLILSIHPNELKQIKDCISSHDVWVKLHSIYQSKGPARKAHLLKQLIVKKMGSNDDVREYVSKFFDLVDKLKDLEVEINSDLLAIMLLYSLPDNFENFRCAIESRDDLPTPEALRIKIIEEHDSRLSKVINSDDNALIAKDWRNNRYNKYKNNYKSNKFNGKCHNCNAWGHKSSDCWRNKSNQKAGQVKEDGFHTVLSTSSDFEKSSGSSWCLDSGCTSHMCSNQSNFKTLEPSADNSVRLADQSSTDIKAKGDVKLCLNNGMFDHNVTLYETLCVPTLRTNLVSVSKITDHGYKVEFTKNIARIIDKYGRTRVIADRRNQLYYLREGGKGSFATSENAKVANTFKKSIVELWHRRMGHLNGSDLLHIMKNDLVLGLNCKYDKFEKLSNCEVCSMGKMTQLPFPKSGKRASKPLEIVHSDVCGPMKISSNGGSVYFITFKDDYSRWTEVRFLKKKSEALEVFKNYKNLVEKQTGYKILNFQSDNGGEFINDDFSSFLAKSGIKRRLSAPQTPQQNGMAERTNRTLLDAARCLLIDSQLSENFWAEAVATACHIKNRCPSKGINGELPFKLWTGKKPTVAYFRRFGCKGFSLDKNRNKGKFKPRAQACILVGYSDESKAYRVWLINEKKIRITRDVKFYDELNGNNLNQDNEFMDYSLLNNIEIHKNQKISDNEIINSKDNSDGISLNKQIVSDSKLRIDPDNFEPEYCKVEENSAPDLSNKEKFKKCNDQLPDKRKRGRPRLLRDGKPGRPKKIYDTICTADNKNETNNYEKEQGNKGDEVEAEDEQDAINFASLVEEDSMEEILNSNDATLWRGAITDEFSSQLINDTWTLCPRPSDKDVIGCRIVLKTKYKSDGSIERRKARLVAKGFSQKPGIDYHETYSPVMRLSTLRTLIAIAVEYNMKIRQLDVETAFLNGELQESVFMEVPEQLEESLQEIAKSKDETLRSKALSMLEQINSDAVCKLNKALYGLKQAGRQWYLKLHLTLVKLGLHPLDADPCLYFTKQGNNILLVGVYVDDIIIGSNNDAWIEFTKRGLMETFKMKDLGIINRCLGLDFKCKTGSVEISQKGYIIKLLEKFNMTDCKAIATPMDVSAKLQLPNLNTPNKIKKYPYRHLVGSLMYLAMATRPDIAYSVSALSQFNDSYGEEHWRAAKRVLRYLKGTMDCPLIFKKGGLLIEGFADADWGNCVVDRRSYSGYVFTLAGAAISWEARKQRTVALSSVEAEYMALAEAAKEAKYLKAMLYQMELMQATIVINNDNQGAQKLVQHPGHHARTKHIDIRHHYIREALRTGIITLKYLPTEYMPADIFTKTLSREKHLYCCRNIGLSID